MRAAALLRVRRLAMGLRYASTHDRLFGVRVTHRIARNASPGEPMTTT